LKQKDFLRDVENAIQFGMPVLLQDVLEELDPSLEPVLNKSIRKIGNRAVIRLGDKEIDYSKDFKFYITTKLGNPHYTPEVSTKTTIVNFSVKQEGLEDQLLGIVVNNEEPRLEEQKSELVIRVAAGQKKLQDLEDTILRLLSEAKGSLLDDENLVVTLQSSKTTSEEVTAQLAVAKETEVKIDQAREGYRSSAVRSAILYFVLNDLARVDPMYQFSLDSYTTLFNQSIINSRRDATTKQDDLVGRNTGINNYHTYAVYTSTCRGLFERHKLLFAFQMTVRILQAEKKVNEEEYSFFLVGGTVLDKEKQKANPCKDWIAPLEWDNITELEKLPAFSGFASVFDQAARDWKAWYMSAKPEEEHLPGAWESKCNDLQRLLVIRCLRPDRVLQVVSRYISTHLGPKYCDPPPFDLGVIYEGSTEKIPLIFVLSPGVDPTAQVFSLAEQRSRQVANCALGQGQAPVAERLVEAGQDQGSWVLLANCHLMLSWMPELENMVETYCSDPQRAPHPDFRLWLSSNPHPKFPITILQRGLKMTTEPPKGLRANLGVLYNTVSMEQFSRCQQSFKYRKLLFALSWFHAVLLERRKFKALGFNVPYEFNQSDYAICHDLIIVFLDEYPERTPWEAMRYLIAEANYGGRVTDDWDRRLVNVYMNQFFAPEAISVNNFPLSSLPEYYLPPDGPLSSYSDYIRTLPLSDYPAAFGQHPNADISSQIEDTRDLLETLLSLSGAGNAAGASTDDAVLQTAKNLADQVPPTFNMRELKSTVATRADPEPLKTVLLQEVDRYNKLLIKLHKGLRDLQLGLQGLVVITAELELISGSCLSGSVPVAWGFCYPSVKPLGPWFSDLVARAGQMHAWVNERMPTVFWLSGFTFPTGFLTALLQTTARKNGVAIDSLSWEFPIMPGSAESIHQPPKEGAYVQGMFLEGAHWDTGRGCLAEPNPMELVAPMPVVHFKPVENKKKAPKGSYTCPCYMYPVRTGTRERPSFVVAIEVKAGQHDADFWTKYGVAILLSLAT